MILNHRIYYQMLRHGVLINFEPFRPWQDPLFWILAWCILNALPHFLLNIWHVHTVRACLLMGHAGCSESFMQLTFSEAFSDTRFLHDAHKVAVFYFVPSVVFFLFLWTSYDINAALVPLSKYFEDDPEAARQA